jgi:hypothetical protein
VMTMTTTPLAVMLCLLAAPAASFLPATAFSRTVNAAARSGAAASSSSSSSSPSSSFSSTTTATTRRMATTTTLSAQKSNKLVIWDCDGCLVDSEALLKQAEVDALHEAGFTEVTRDDCNRLFSGYAPEEGAKRFEAEFGKPLPEHFFRDQIANSLQLFRDKLEGLNTNVRIKSN